MHGGTGLNGHRVPHATPDTYQSPSPGRRVNAPGLTRTMLI